MLYLEIARSGRMRCGKCGDRIEKGSVRVRVDSCTCRHLCCADDVLGKDKLAEIIEDVRKA